MREVSQPFGVWLGLRSILACSDIDVIVVPRVVMANRPRRSADIVTDATDAIDVIAEIAQIADSAVAHATLSPRASRSALSSLSRRHR